MVRLTLTLLALGAAGTVAWCGSLAHVPPPPGLPLPSCPDDFDLEEGRLTVTLYPERGLVEGKAVLWGRLYGPDPNFPFLVHSRAQVPSVRMADGTRLVSRRAGHRMDVLVPPAPRRPRYMGIQVEWLVKVGGPSVEGEITPFLTQQGAFLPSDLCWHPRGLYNDRAKYQLVLRMPRDWKVEGLGTERQRFMEAGRVCYRYRLDSPVEAMAFVAGPFVETSWRDFFGGQVRSLALPGCEASPLRDHTTTMVEILKFYRRLLGDPVFGRYTVVDMPPGLVGFPQGAPYRVAAEQRFALVAAPPQAAKGPYLEFLGTESARHWFERRVTFRDHLGEALCIYMGMLAVRKFDGRDAFLRGARAKAARFRAAAASGMDARPAGIRGLGENVGRSTYEHVARTKVPLLLLHLEQACGGVKPFMRILRRFVYHHRDGPPVGWPELMDVYEKDSGVDLSTFSLLYVDGPGLPPDTAGRVGYDVLPDDADEGTDSK